MLPITNLLELNHRHVTSSASTNSELIEALQSGSLDIDKKHLLTSDSQSAGRGQHGRSWQSPRGNVYLSLYHPIHIPVSGLLSSIIGVELVKMPAIQELNEQLLTQGMAPVGVKWANDLGFYNQRQNESALGNDKPENQTLFFSKLAGILIEPVSQRGKLIGVVIGVGLNVQATPKLTLKTREGMRYQAISLQDIANMIELTSNSSSLPELQSLYKQMSKALIAAMTRFEYLHLERLNSHTYYLDNFLEQFDSMDLLAGLHLQITQEYNGQTNILTGHACGIDKHGCLQLHQDDGCISKIFTGRIEVINNDLNIQNVIEEMAIAR